MGGRSLHDLYVRPFILIGLSLRQHAAIQGRPPVDALSLNRVVSAMSVCSPLSVHRYTSSGPKILLDSANRQQVIIHGLINVMGAAAKCSEPYILQRRLRLRPSRLNAGDHVPRDSEL